MRPLRQRHDPAAVKGVEQLHPIKAVPYELSELLLDDLHLVPLCVGTAPRPTLLLHQPPAGKRWKWRPCRIPNVEPLPMPSPVGVTWGVRGIRASRMRLPLQGEAFDRCDLSQTLVRHSSLEEEKPEEIHVRLHPEESLADGDKASNVQHPRRIEML